MTGIDKTERFPSSQRFFRFQILVLDWRGRERDSDGGESTHPLLDSHTYLGSNSLPILKEALATEVHLDVS